MDESQHQVREAIGAISTMACSQVVTWPAAPWSAQPTGQRPQVESMYPQGLHDHPHAELCISLAGSPVMYLGGERFEFQPPALALLSAGVVHSEAYSRANQGYSLMWLSFNRQTLFSHGVVFEPERGWRSTGRLATTGASVSRLREVANRPLESTDQFEQLRAIVLQVLSELYCEAVEAELRAGKAGQAEHVQQAVVQWVREYLDTHFSQPISVKSLAQLTGYTPNYLSTLFASHTGMPIHVYLTDQRMQRAMSMLRTSDDPVSQIAVAVGYRDPLYFSRAFRRHHNMSPTEARDSH